MSISIGLNDVERVEVGYSRLWVHPGLKTEMAVVKLEFGSDELDIRFTSWQAMIDFCEAHNFPYTDRRGEV